MHVSQPTPTRKRLPDRRGSLTFPIEVNGLKFTATASTYPDGTIGEVFLTNALQYGLPLDVIRKTLMRDAKGRASGPLGAALDVLAADDGGAS
jgi:hypothetical protein